MQRARLEVGLGAHVHQLRVSSALDRGDDLGGLNTVAVLPPPAPEHAAVDADAQDGDADGGPRPRKGPRRRVLQPRLGLREDAPDVGEIRLQRVGLGEPRHRRRIALGEQRVEPGLPRVVELALAGHHHRRADEELLHVTGGNQEVEALHDGAARGRQRRERHDAEQRGVVADGGAAGIAVRGRGVRLHDVLADGVLLEAGDGAVGHRRLERRGLVEQLVRQHDTGKADDVHRVADLRLAVAQANGRIHVVLHAHQREVTAGIGRGLAVEVEGERRTELDDVRLEADAARQQHRQQRLRRHLRRRHRAHGGVAADRVLDVGTLAAHQPLRAQGRIHARLVDRLLLQLVDDPRGQAVRGLDDVRVGDEVALAVDEPAGARLDERRGPHRDRAAPAVQRDLPAHLRRHQRDGGLGEQDGFLHAEGGRRGRRQEREGREPQDEGRFHRS